jgi:hypothetical protein
MGQVAEGGVNSVCRYLAMPVAEAQAALLQQLAGEASPAAVRQDAIARYGGDVFRGRPEVNTVYMHQCVSVSYSLSLSLALACSCFSRIWVCAHIHAPRLMGWRSGAQVPADMRYADDGIEIGVNNDLYSHFAGQVCACACTCMYVCVCVRVQRFVCGCLCVCVPVYLRFPRPLCACASRLPMGCPSPHVYGAAARPSVSLSLSHALSLAVSWVSTTCTSTCGVRWARTL